MVSKYSAASFVCVGVAMLACGSAACGASSSSASGPAPVPAPVPEAGTDDGGAMPPPDASDGGSGCTPKTGFETAVKLGTVGGLYAHESLALGPKDEPYVAFVGYDLVTRENSALYFVAYDTEACAWKTPVKIDTVDRLTNNPTLREVQLVRDKSNGRLHVAYEVDAHLPAPNGDTHMMLAHSSDEGVTWTKEEVAHDDQAPGDNLVYQLAHPTLAVANGKTAYAYYGNYNIANACSAQSECNAWVVKTRTGDSGPFVGGIVQSATGNSGAEANSGALAFDAAGNAGFVFFSRPDSTKQNLVLEYLTVGQTKAVAVFDSQGVQNDQPALALTFEGTKPRVSAALVRSSAPTGTNVWFSASDDGTTWSAPVEIPHDGGDSMGSYMSLAASPLGGLTLAVAQTGGNGQSGQCGAPKLATTTAGGMSFMTCGADPDVANGIGAAGDDVQVAYAANGKRVLAFDYPADSGALKAGVTVWREP